jgi:hypothetical protein
MMVVCASPFVVALTHFLLHLQSMREGWKDQSSFDSTASGERQKAPAGQLLLHCGY